MNKILFLMSLACSSTSAVAQASASINSASIDPVSSAAAQVDGLGNILDSSPKELDERTYREHLTSKGTDRVREAMERT